ncbi:MAG TPA: helix-turn-helix domain-containing protein [Candidatus Limnocylindria bacterium]|jgi:DNA-binding HxlR family transcriptional regulator|nr:helix-turn-helix domain-containing protein [Candidatus Limnocylindria bacterium]
MEKHENSVELALEVVGYKWALLIVRELLAGQRRFTEIARSLPRANQKMITARLRELEAAGVLTRTTYAEVPPRVEYSLTARGRALRPVITALRSWGNGLPAPAERRKRRSASAA